jgi:hypothetical protein
VYDRNAVSQATLQFTGMLTNKNGDPLVGGINAQFEDTKCDYQKFSQVSSHQSDLVTMLSNVTDLIEMNTLRYRIGMELLNDC